MTVTLGQLLEGNPPLELARPSESVAEVMERMREHDYSQLPVVDEAATQLRAIGLISTATIANASLHLELPPSKLRVHHALERHPIRRTLDDELWRTLDVVRNGEVLLVEDHTGLLRGILTGQDFATYLRRQAEDNLTVLDIEAAVKQLISENYRDREEQLREQVERTLGVQQRENEKSARALVSRCLGALSVNPKTLDPAVFGEAFSKAFPDRTIYEFDRLTFSQYQSILLSGDCWDAYKDDFELPVEHVRALLDVTRNLRNQIMHNRGLPTPAERARLVFCRELFGRVADSRQDATQPAATQPAATQPAAEPAAAPPVPSSSVDDRQPAEGDEAEDDDGSAQSLVPWHWLERFDNSSDRVSLSFDDIEGFTRSPLPPTARQHRSWWTNDEQSPQSAQWLDANWRIVNVNLTAGTVTFGRNTDREQSCIAIFGTIFRRLGESPSWRHRDRLPSPAGRTWQDIQSFTVDGCSVRLSLGFTIGERFRISVVIDAPDQRVSKATYDAFAAHRDELERSLGSTLSWERKPHRRASRVSLMYPRDVSTRAPHDVIEELAAWVAEHAPRLWAAVQRYLAGVTDPS